MMKEKMRQAFSSLHPSRDILAEVLKQADAQKARRSPSLCRLCRSVVVAVLVTATLTVTVFAADYVINQRDIFFFDTLEALTKFQTAQNGNSAAAVSVAMPNSAEENEEMETAQQYVSRWMDGELEGETVLSQQQGDPTKTGWERRRVTKREHPVYGPIVNEYLSGSIYASQIVVEGVTDWDTSWLCTAMSPDENGQLITISRDEKTGETLSVVALAGYHTAQGKPFLLSYNYDSSEQYWQGPEYILNSAYDTAEVFRTEDNVDVLVQSYDGQVWAIAANVEKTVSIYTTGYTVPEMKELLNHLNLAEAIG